MIKNILLIFIILSIFILITLGTYDISKGKLFKKIGHDIFDHPIPNDKVGFNGCSFTCTCKICGKKILQDGQGNWFHK